MRLAWPPPRHLIASVLISVVALAMVHLSPSAMQDILSPLALILVFFIPGYLATLSIFPGKSDLSGKGRAFLCLASSAMLAGLFSLILASTPRGLQSASLATILSLLAIFLAAVAYGRWSNLPRTRRFILMPKRGLGSKRPISRAALAVLLLAACFIAALALAFGPYQFSFEEPSASIDAATSGEALASPSPSFEGGKKQFESYSPYERLGVDQSQNNSSNSSIQTLAASSDGINSAGLNDTENNDSPEILNDKTDVAVFSMGGGGGGGSSTAGSSGSGSSSSSSQTVTKKPATNKVLQPEKTAGSSPTAAAASSVNVQSNTSIAGNNSSNASLTSRDNLTLKGNLTEKSNLTESGNPKGNDSTKIEDNASVQLPASTIDANETKDVSKAAIQGSTEPVNVPSPDTIIDAVQNTNGHADNSSVKVSAKSASSIEDLSIESDLSRAVRQYEINLAESNGEGFDDSNQPPVLKSLVPDRASPQTQGSAIFWKAEATDEEGDKILYSFFLNGREVRKWSKINSWSWLSQGLPAGDYLITVLAIDGNHASQDSFDSILNTSFTLSRPNQGPVLQQLKPNRSSPQGKGSIITWTAVASDPDNDTVYYKFLKNDEAVSDWSPSDTWVWDTSLEKVGDYKIAVLAKDGLHASKNSFDSSMEDKFALTLPNSIPEVTALKVDRPSPQAAGSAITWTASAVDPDGDDISYKFLVNDKEVRQWSPLNSWRWDTSSEAPGEYRIKVLARDGSHSSEESFDSSKDAVMTIAIADSNQPPVLSSLVCDIPSPDVQGVTVSWKAEAQDPEGDKIFYKFQLNGRDMGRWSESASWKWSTSDLPPGEYKIRALARDGKHAPESSFDSSKDAVFSLISEIDRQIDQLMKKRSKDASQQDSYQSSDIRVVSGNDANSNVILGKSNGTAGEEGTVTPRKLGG